jgi:hypothetical protein
MPQVMLLGSLLLLDLDAAPLVVVLKETRTSWVVLRLLVGTMDDSASRIDGPSRVGGGSSAQSRVKLGPVKSEWSLHADRRGPTYMIMQRATTSSYPASSINGSIPRLSSRLFEWERRRAWVSWSVRSMESLLFIATTAIFSP